MEIKNAIAGTLESSDVMITIHPSNTREISIKSRVFEIFGRQIMETIESVLDEREIENVNVMVVDQGALDFTLRARLNTALDRALGIEKKWSL